MSDHQNSVAANAARISDTRVHVSNPRCERGVSYPSDLNAVLCENQAELARAAIEAWPSYCATPLVALPGLAGRLGLGSLNYKDEGGRFGLGSFKALGGAYAVLRHLAGVVAPVLSDSGLSDSGLSDSGRDAAEAVISGDYKALTQVRTVCCATDGNHGRSVAWGAALFGCRCVIYVHETVSEGRADAIEAYGATVIRHPGNYDETVHRAAADAESNGWTVISDTSYEGYTDIPRDVMHGYTVMAAEAFDQWPPENAPSHVVVPGGVGGVAAAVCAAGWWRFGADRPRLIVVEPSKAACLMESAHQARWTALRGDIETVMAGLSCGEPSLIAWRVLDRGADDFTVVSDAQAKASMITMASPADGDPAVVCGESAAASIAVLEQAHADPELAKVLGLDHEARVLVFGTEGDTDPDLYQRIVGQTADAVRMA